MASPDIAERLAELLHLPVEVVRDYGKPRTWVAARRVRKIGRAVEKQRPPATMKDSGERVTPSVAPYKEYKEEDDLYQKWRDAPVDEKPDLEKQQFKVVKKHAKAVIWEMAPEANEGLADEIASQVIERLPKFRQEAKFSTWSHRIMINQCNLYLRRTIPEKDRFYMSPGKPEDDIKLADPRAKAAFDRAEGAIDYERLVGTLPRKDYVLLQCRLAGMTVAEAAKKLGDLEDAAESRWRRLKARLKKELRGKSDGK
jgi:RNA polymerase sigma factor (sigma-70 family)